MKLDPRHLIAVLAIVEHGTFNRAADALGISQPALSKTIALLERRIGAKVFERGARGSTLTDVGAIVARRAQNLDMVLTRTDEELAAHAKRLEGPIVIGATPSMIRYLAPEALARLAAELPQSITTLVEGLDDQLAPALARGEIDLLVAPIDGLRPVGADFTEIKVAEDPFLIGVPNDHPLAGRDGLRMSDLQGQRWVLPNAGSSFYRVVESLFTAAGLPWPTDAITTNSLHTQERLIARTGRLGFMTRVQILAHDLDFGLIPLVDAPARGIGLRRRKGVKLSPIADAFQRHLQDVAASWVR